MKKGNELTDYDVEKLLYKAAGLDEFAHYLINEIDNLEEMKNNEALSALNYLEIVTEINELKRVRDVYCSYKRNGKLPKEIEEQLKAAAE